MASFVEIFIKFYAKVIRIVIRVQNIVLNQLFIKFLIFAATLNAYIFFNL
jgi:hypothetical protein